MSTITIILAGPVFIGTWLLCEKLDNKYHIIDKMLDWTEKKKRE